MDLEWKNLVEKGWLKEEITQNGKKKIVYKTPVENGIRRIIRQAKDLKKHEEKYVKILFPHSDLSKKPSLQNLQLETENIEGSISSVELQHSDFPNKITKVEKEKEKLEESASRLYPNNKETDDNLGDRIQEYVKKVNNLLEDNTES